MQIRVPLVGDFQRSHPPHPRCLLAEFCYSGRRKDLATLHASG